MVFWRGTPGACVMGSPKLQNELIRMVFWRGTMRGSGDDAYRTPWTKQLVGEDLMNCRTIMQMCRRSGALAGVLSVLYVFPAFPVLKTGHTAVFNLLRLPRLCC